MAKWEGWIKLHRKLCINDLWLSEPFTRGQAWVDLILLANHEKGSIRIRGIWVDIERGQVGWSETSLSHRWGWSRKKVSMFLKELEEREQQIKVDKSNLSTIITILRYKEYQKRKDEAVDESTAEEPQKNGNRTAEEPQKNPNKKVKKLKKDKNDKESLKHIYDSKESKDLFEKFWKEYPRRPKGNKSKSREYFFKYKPEIQEQIYSAMKEYTQYWEEQGTEDQHKKMPQGFINGDYWHEDQVPQSRKTKYEQDMKERENSTWENPLL